MRSLVAFALSVCAGLSFLLLASVAVLASDPVEPVAGSLMADVTQVEAVPVLTTVLESRQVTESTFMPVIRIPMSTSVMLVDPQPEWTADWWQWVERLNNLPVEQQGDVDCGLGQSGDVWFLAGTQGGPQVVRNCTVPEGKILAVPLLTAAWGNEGDENLTVEEKRAVLAAIFSDTEPGLLNTKVCGLDLTINGASIANTRLQSPPFLYLGDPEGVADGYWAAFQLPASSHQINVVGTLCDFATSVPIFTVDVIYNLTAEAS